MTKNSNSESDYALAQVSDLAKAIEGIEKLLDRAPNKATNIVSITPSIHVANLKKGTTELVRAFMNQHEEFQRLEKNIQSLYEIARENEATMNAFEKIDEVLFRCPNILQAMTYVAESFEKDFREKTGILFVFGPNTNKENDSIENSLASVIIDTIDMGKSDTEQSKKAAKLTELVRFTRGSIENSANEKLFIEKNDYEDLISEEQSYQFIGPGEKLTKLNEIVGIPKEGSALLYRIPHIDLTIVCSSENPNYYFKEQDADLVNKGLRSITRGLALIGQKEESNKDEMTKLLMRRNAYKALREFMKKIKEEERSGKEEIGNTPICIFTLDIDHFKMVNDTYGHAMGDMVISALAEALRKSIRSTDIIARWGGEEFVIVMKAPKIHASKTLLNVIRNFAKKEFTGENGEIFSKTVSIGGLEILSEELGDGDKTTFDALLEKADKGLYHSKNTGRNRLSWKDGESVIIDTKE